MIPLSCTRCHTEQVARGLTDEAAERAANDGPTCCPTITLAAVGEAPAARGTTSASLGGDAGTGTGRIPDAPQASGIPTRPVPIFAPLTPRDRLVLAAMYLVVIGAWGIAAWLAWAINHT